MTEQEIVQAAMTRLHATGSKAELAKVANSLLPMITAYFENLGRADAAELAESVFRAVALHRDRFQPGRCAYNWVFSIATRLIHQRERAEVTNAKREVAERRLAALCK